MHNERTLTPIEEKVLRMRHGIKARGFTRLEKAGDGHPAAAEQLAQLEQRLLAASPAPARAQRRGQKKG